MVHLGLTLPLLALLAAAAPSMAQHAPAARAHHRRLALAHPGPHAAAPAPGLAFRNIHLDARAGAPQLNDSLTSSVVPSESITVSTPGASSPVTSAAQTSAVAQTSSLVSASASASSSSVATTSATQTTAAATTVTSTSTSTPATTTAAATTPTAAATTPTTSSRTTPTTTPPAPTLLGTSATKNTGTVASHSAGSTFSAAAASTSNTTSGLSKTGLIAIIVVSVLVALGIAWTLFRKLVLKPSRTHRSRRGRAGRAGARAVDFSPAGGLGLPDPFFEKTRRASQDDADRQRRQFVSELEHDEHGAAPGYPPLVEGIPSHDFTAGPASSYAPYGVAEAHEMQYAPDAHGHGAYATDPAAGQGYADLHRGPSDGAAYAPQHEYHDAYAGHGEYGAPLDPHAHAQAYPEQGMHPQEQGLPYAAYGGAEQAYPQHAHHAGPDMYEHHQPEGLGRPTQGEGPYMIASQAGYGGR